MNISSIIEYFKFGFNGETIDLIYLFLILRFFVYDLIRWFLPYLKEAIGYEHN